MKRWKQIFHTYINQKKGVAILIWDMNIWPQRKWNYQSQKQDLPDKRIVIEWITVPKDVDVQFFGSCEWCFLIWKKKFFRACFWWLTLVILVTWEAEIWRIVVKASLGKKFARSHFFLFFYSFIHMCKHWAISPPPTPLTSRQNLFCPYL
jgi:hypothetical protein